MNSRTHDPRYDQLSQLLFAAVREASRSPRSVNCPIKQSLLQSLGDCEHAAPALPPTDVPSRPPTGEFEIVDEGESAFSCRRELVEV